MHDDLTSLLEFNQKRLHSLALSRQQHLDGWLEKLKTEEEIAAQLFYTHLLGKSSDHLPGFTRSLIHQADFSGDLILAKKTPDGRIFCLLADATGHGLSAALTLMPAASLFRSLVEQGANLNQLVETINQELNENLPGDRFIAALLVELDLAEQQMQVWNGGLPPLFLLDTQGQILQQVVSHNLALGILCAKQLEPLIAHLHLPSTGQLFAATDGLMEARNATGEMFAQNQLQAGLIRAAGKPPLAVLLNELQYFTGESLEELDDDLSIMHLDLQRLYREQATQPVATVKEV